MLTLLKSIYWSVITPNFELAKIINFAHRACSCIDNRHCLVLDVGCGYGQKLQLLNSAGFHAIGVEINNEIVESNRKTGLNCLTIEEFKTDQRCFDVILMSHVIEHFTPEQLLPFIDTYLDKLKPNGSLIIATPLSNPFFYDDFDHVKPYHPTGLVMVFGEERAQVQYYARNRLILEDIWFRHSPFRLGHGHGRHIKSWRTKARQLVDFGCAIIFHISCGLISRTDGWVGLFRKSS